MVMSRDAVVMSLDDVTWRCHVVMSRDAVVVMSPGDVTW